MAPPINPLNHPPTHQTMNPPIGGGSPQISNVQTELKYLDSFKCYWIFTDLGGPPGGGGWGRGGGIKGDLEMMWGWQGQCGDDRDDMGMTRMTWGRRGRPHPLTHPSIQPSMNSPMGSGVSANHKSSNRIELSWLSQDLFDFLWFDMAPPINPPNHRPTHQTKPPTIGGGVSTDFKSSNRIKISQFVQVLLNFYWLWWSPRVGVGGGLNGGFLDDVGMTGMMWGWQGQHGDDGDDGEDTTIMINMLTVICNFLHVCMHVCVCVCTCVGTPAWPQTPSHPPAPSPELQAAQNTKIE